MSRLWLERAWLGSGARDGWTDGRVAAGVSVVVEAGRFAEVTPGSPPAPDAQRIPGLTLPGLANAHSHVFHRALRGRTQRERGSFWSWREQMYALADRLDPDLLHDLALAAYREMVAAGFTAVGEFHYLHHGPGGAPYDDPNETGRALVRAAREAGIRIALLDTCYLAAGPGEPPAGVQTRFSDGDAERWAERVDALAASAPGPEDGVVVGAAVHSVRAVPPEQVPVVAGWAERRGAPVHVHLSEQVAENAAALAAHGRTPTALLADAGALGPRTTAVHATHLTDADVRLLGDATVFACFCPTTERDLGDGVGPSRALHEAGARLTVGSDSHAVVDPFEEMRAVELDERLSSRSRGHWSAAELLTAATATGHASLGFADAGRIAVGARADLVTLDTASPRTAGTGGGAECAVFAAGTADVVRVMVDGRVVATRDDHDDIGRSLDRSITRAWGEDA